MKTLVAVKKGIEVIDAIETGIEARRIRHGEALSLKCVSSRMGISIIYLSELERGRKNWSDALIEKFNRAIKEDHNG